jgi:uncharacterized membrane protein
MNRFNLSKNQREILAHAFMCIVISTVLFVLSLLLILLWNGLNYLLDYKATIDYGVLWYVYAVCWIAALVINYFFIKSTSKSSGSNKLWDHEMDRRYIGDLVGEDYFDTSDPYDD